MINSKSKMQNHIERASKALSHFPQNYKHGLGDSTANTSKAGECSTNNPDLLSEIPQDNNDKTGECATKDISRLSEIPRRIKRERNALVADAMRTSMAQIKRHNSNALVIAIKHILTTPTDTPHLPKDISNLVARIKNNFSNQKTTLGVSSRHTGKFLHKGRGASLEEQIFAYQLACIELAKESDGELEVIPFSLLLDEKIIGKAIEVGFSDSKLGFVGYIFDKCFDALSYALKRPPEFFFVLEVAENKHSGNPSEFLWHIHSTILLKKSEKANAKKALKKLNKLEKTPEWERQEHEYYPHSKMKEILAYGESAAALGHAMYLTKNVQDLRAENNIRIMEGIPFFEFGAKLHAASKNIRRMAGIVSQEFSDLYDAIQIVSASEYDEITHLRHLEESKANKSASDGESASKIVPSEDIEDVLLVDNSLAQEESMLEASTDVGNTLTDEPSDDGLDEILHDLSNPTCTMEWYLANNDGSIEWYLANRHREMLVTNSRGGVYRKSLPSWKEGQALLLREETIT